MDTQSQAKLCIRCGQDCSTRPRLKDRQGRYCCKQCSPAQPPQADEPQHIEPGPPDAEPALIPLDDLEKVVHRAPCLQCGGELLIGVAACPTCGFIGSLARPAPASRTSATGKRKAKSLAIPCRQCQYDLRGVPATPAGMMLCPECGTNNPPRGRRELDEEVSRDAAKAAWIKPVAITGCGIVLGSIGLLAFGGVEELIVGAIAYVGSVVVSFVLICLCCLVWVGFDTPIEKMALHVAAVHAATGSLLVLVGALTGGMISLALTGALYVYLLTDLLEFEVHQAIIIMMMNLCLYLGVGFVLWMVF